MKIKTSRINAYNASSGAMDALMDVEKYLSQSSLDKTIGELVKILASQINGCAFCIDLHTKDARQAGETEQRIYMLSAWRESHLYSDKERAALAWTEELTLIAQNHVDDPIYNEVREHFTEEEMTDLTTLIGQINTWNRLAIGFRYEHG